MKEKLLQNRYKTNPEKSQGSSIISIENSEALEIFGVENENLNFFEKILPVKVFQKGNQLTIRGSKKNINILTASIVKTISDKKSMNKKIIIIII